AEKWSTRSGQKVPESSDLRLANDSIELDGAVLYADLAESTKLVRGWKDYFASEIYKAYLMCAARIIRSEGGSITSYDGDRIMAVFIGEGKETIAVRTALKINFAVKKILTPALVHQYPKTNFNLKQRVGIDTSRLWIARTGIRGSNDLVWVGRAANYAAKLTSLSAEYPTWITNAVYNRLHDSVKFSKSKNMWEARSWTPMDNHSIFRSTYYWNLE
ncbi:MAG: adenylate/guanylate cyclase domain-containing protein, partial [Taibaiella sp.]|nr:adenylate/guanylate cyclase domain-containing protein [Taibaiella sp.]